MLAHLIKVCVAYNYWDFLVEFYNWCRDDEKKINIIKNNVRYTLSLGLESKEITEEEYNEAIVLVNDSKFEELYRLDCIYDINVCDEEAIEEILADIPDETYILEYDEHYEKFRIYTI